MPWAQPLIVGFRAAFQHRLGDLPVGPWDDRIPAAFESGWTIPIAEVTLSNLFALNDSWPRWGLCRAPIDVASSGTPLPELDSGVASVQSQAPVDVR